MNNPIGPDFDWSSLYSKYDATCKNFHSNSPHLFALEEEPRNDRNLYYSIIKRINKEVTVDGYIGLGTYEAILYWKLYSQPAAVKNVCWRIRRDKSIQQSIDDSLQRLFDQLPPNVNEEIDQIRHLYGLVNQHGSKLYGMANSCALPTRSTLLHFLYPDKVPIFDKQVLLAVGVTEKNGNQRYDVLFDYIQFTWDESKESSVIPQDWEETPLRLLDMALWVTRGRQ